MTIYLSMIISDEYRIRQIIFNLLNNALKFTDKGQITIRESAQVKDQHCALILGIEDSARGIPEKEQATVFDKFQQVDEQQPSTFAGSGLGLSISRKLTDLLGGEISLVSQSVRKRQYILRTVKEFPNLSINV